MKRLFLLFPLLGLTIGCQTPAEDEAADAKWRQDYASCRFGMTAEQLDEFNENPESKERPRQKLRWQACLLAQGWNTQTGPNLGPQFED